MEQLYLDRYARVLVEVGVNLQKDQYLVVQATTETLPLARAVTKAAFAKGAKDVCVLIEDMEIKHEHAKHASTEICREVPQWKKDQLDYYLSKGGAQIGLMGSFPTLMNDVDDANALAVAKADNDVRNVIRAYIHKGTLQWTGTAVPTMDWAKKVYPELEDEAALKQLEDDVIKMMRLDNDDPVQAWKDHCASMAHVSKALNDYNFKSLHITSELGTDLTMDLVENHIWTSAADMGESLTPVAYVANMPTEEVFTDPNRFTVNGKAVASRPLMLSGKLVENFWIEFKDGLAVDCGASANEQMLRDALFKDEFTRRLGEVALVSKQSKITQMNRVYFNGLIDENAASHLAFGTSFSSNVKGGTNMSDEELLAIGVNVASSHNDFMVGTPEYHVEGITHDGQTIVIMDHGDFVI